jgi:inorganic triphosphatase YgiF
LRLAVKTPENNALRSVYFDTPGADLRHSQLTLRLRRKEKAWWQALKQEDAAAAGLHIRSKSEYPVPSGGLDLEKIENERLRRKLRKWQTAGDLVPRFETVVNRTTWVLNTPDGGVVECAIDRGKVRTLDGRADAPLSEVELELKQGPVSELFVVARELAASVPMALEYRSKAERGYALWRSELLSKPAKANLPQLDRRATAAEALAQIVRTGLAHLQRNWQAAALATRYNPEHVHQMRVATRRLRTAFLVFAQLDGALKMHPLVAELRWLAASLGEARNWDVLVGETFPKLLAAFPEEPSLGRLARKASIHRRRRRVAADETLRSARYFSLVLNLSEFALKVPENEALSTPIVPAAANLLARRHKQLRKRAHNLTKLGSNERHALRIAAKRLRYTTEFFESLFGGGALDRFLRRSGGLQKALGALNDLATTRRLMLELADAGNAETQRTLALCTGWCVGVEEASSAELARSWKSVRRISPFWPNVRSTRNGRERENAESPTGEPPPSAVESNARDHSVTSQEE